MYTHVIIIWQLDSRRIPIPRRTEQWRSSLTMVIWESMRRTYGSCNWRMRPWELYESPQSNRRTLGSGNYWFYEEDGLLYRHWHPREEGEELGIEQLIIPKQHREAVLRLAHEIPLAGHLGKKKTVERILQRFYWPTLYRDVAEWCRTCEQCQKHSAVKNLRAPLVPLPVIEEPFTRIAMDIVGPLPRSSTGNSTYLLCAIMLLATRKQYP